MDEVRLGYDDSGALFLGDVIRHESGELASITARLEIWGLSASQRVTPNYVLCFDDLVSYLEDMAAHWQGWDGAKTYSSLEGELKLSAVRDGVGHVLLTVTLRGPTPDYEWEARATFHTDPGTQMETAASDARDLLARRV